VAEVRAWRGERDQANAWLERARAQRDPGLSWLKSDPLFGKVRGEPRYAAFLSVSSLIPRAVSRRHVSPR
jgi:hypothetical protein